MAITDLEIRMTIKTLAAKGVANRAIARQHSLSEGTVVTTHRTCSDVCAPYSPEHKGKVERAVGTQRWGQDPQRRPWDSLEELQSHTDAALTESARRRRCPSTGTSVYEVWQAERAYLASLPTLPEPFDLVATRRVANDALVAFEGRQYSVPFTCWVRPWSCAEPHTRADPGERSDHCRTSASHRHALGVGGGPKLHRYWSDPLKLDSLAP